MSIFNMFKKKKKTIFSSAPPSSPKPQSPYMPPLHPSLNPTPISKEEYQAIRKREIGWLETHYDLNSEKGIISICENEPPSCPAWFSKSSSPGCTGDIDYYLRQKSSEYEESGNIKLAILCLKKSNAIRMKCRKGYRKNDYYTLVRLLARNGYVEEAKQEKERIDRFFEHEECERMSKEMISRLLQGIKDCNTDLVLMSALGNSCPECAQYQGRVFSVYGVDQRFPRMPQSFWEYGAIHPGCRHSFHPFIYGLTDPDLRRTLSVHRLLDRRYARDIITFSNRPFVDDRLQCDIDEANRYREEKRLEDEKKKANEDSMIEREAEKGRAKRTYQWIQENLPDLCPKSFAGYMRMKKTNSTGYQKIVAKLLEMEQETEK